MPFAVRLHRIGQRPCEVAADDDIEGFVRKVELLRIHLPKIGPAAERREVLLRLIDHARRHVDARDLMSHARKQHNKETCTRADVEDAQRAALRQMTLDELLPKRRIGAFELSSSHVGKCRTPRVPIAFNPLSQRLFSLDHFLRFHLMLSPLHLPPASNGKSPPPKAPAYEAISPAA